jgi:Contractile injection system spike tip protein
MLDSILATGDLAIFIDTEGKAIVSPGILIGTGKAQIQYRTICLEGDEKKIIVSYTSPPHVIPGSGILIIDKSDQLPADNKAKKVKSGGKALLLKGKTFEAKLKVLSPAIQPLPPKPDKNKEYKGRVTFMTTNFRAKAT